MKIKVLVFLILLITLPYVIGVRGGGEDLVFNGFLLNIIDGNSYIGKMREGWLGSWQFSMLSSSVAPGENYIYLFNIFLGHVARWLGLSLVFTYHAARVSGAILLWWMLYRFVDVYLDGRGLRAKTIALVLVCFGSGLGWLAAMFGTFTFDYWIPEAYPFLAMYSNPHFPLGLALVIDFFVKLRKPFERRNIVWLVLEGMLLGVVMQFGVVVAGVVAGGIQLWEMIKKQHPIRWWMLWFLIPGGLVLTYQYVVLKTDPVLAGWNVQNIAISPPLWDVLVSFSPALILAVWAIVQMVRSGQIKEYKLLVVWSVAGLILAYFPFQLQRRFLLGYYIPLACLAAITIDWAIDQGRRFLRTGAMLVIAVSFMTNLVVIGFAIKEVQQHQPDLFYPKSMQSAFDWMLANRPQENVVLSAPRTGIIIPGETGWRVVFGHPLETPNAYLTQLTLEQIFYGMKSPNEILEYIEMMGVDYVFIGPLEREFGSDLTWADQFPVVYKSADETIYQTGVDS